MATILTRRKTEKLNATFTKAHSDYAKVLKTRAFFKVQNGQTSEDLVQASFLKTWTYLVRGGKIETMKAFLYHVLNGLIIDEYRKNKPVSLDTMLETGFDPGFDEQERNMNIFDG